MRNVLRLKLSRMPAQEVSAIYGSAPDRSGMLETLTIDYGLKSFERSESCDAYAINILHGHLYGMRFPFSEDPAVASLH